MAHDETLTLIQQFWEGKTTKGTLSKEELDQARRLIEQHFPSVKKGSTMKSHRLLRLYTSLLLGQVFPDKKELRNQIERHRVLSEHLRNHKELTPENKKLIADVLNHLIDYGVTRGIWKNKYILNIAIIRGEKNPFATQQQWQDFLLAEKLVLAFRQDQSSHDNESDKIIARIIFSLMIDSFLIQEKHLKSVLNALTNKSNIHFLAGLPFVEFPFDGLNARTKWFIAPQTVRLFVPLEVMMPLEDNQKIVALLADYFVPLVAFPKQLPTRLSGWIKLASQYLRMQLPPFIHAIARGQFESHSLFAHASNRIFRTDLETPQSGFKQFEIAKEKRPEKNTNHFWREIRAFFNHAARDKQLDNIYQAGAALLNAPLPDIEQDIDVPGHPYDNYLLMLEWGLHQLPSLNSKTSSPSPTKVLSYMDAIAGKLFALAENAPIEKLSSDARFELYTSVVELACSPINRKSILYSLKKFDNWLVSHKNAEPLEDAEELFAEAKSTQNAVNANLITFDEYQATKNLLLEASSTWPQGHFNYPKAALIFLILGFKLGLRRSEIAQIKINDLIIEEPEKDKYGYELKLGCVKQIAIRESHLRQLKNANAKRFLNVADFLDKSEIEQITSWYNEAARGNRIDTGKGFLFSLDENKQRAISSSLVTTPLLDVIHQVTGDNTLKFHQLRHSFASWLMLSAIGAESNIDFSGYFQHLPKTKEWLLPKNVEDRKKQHFGHHDLSKKYTYWLQKKIGHASIQTTLVNYIHFMDIAISGYQCRSWLNSLIIAEELMMPYSTLAKKKGVARIQSMLNHFKKQANHGNWLFQRSHYHTPKRDWEIPKNVHFPKVDFLLEYPFMQSYRIYEMIKNDDKIAQRIAHISSSLKIPMLHIETILEVYENDENIPHMRGKVPDKDLFEILQKINACFPEMLELDTNVNVADVLGEYPDWYEFTLIVADLLYFENRSNASESNMSHLLLSSGKAKEYGRPLVEILNQMKLPYEVILRHSTIRTKKELRNFKLFWTTALNLPSDKMITLRRDGEKKKGEYDRVEIKVNKHNGRRNAAFYFIFIQLNAHFGAMYKIQEKEAEIAKKNSYYL
ncbi:hypothetical protein [Thiomicrospira sp. S5]|uniref:hypothetical protein n=1 Tax=Thiomicrospira sp. S5 TaxID=1803865 RepID=UPI000F8A0C11|nr:hypothetical protein [Thiomicrospira sp. S5]AZR81055.1 hypothetical protein AYJ59_01325 [Thiomicrospira sp. S5]